MSEAGTNARMIAAQAVAQSLVDADFKHELLADPLQALAKKGAHFPSGHRVVVLTDTANHKHVAVPVAPLPEAQRVPVLPRDPTPYQMALWAITTVQDGSSLADSLLANPIRVLRDRGVRVPSSLQVSLHRDTESVTHLTLPHQGPLELAGDELSDEMLDAVVGGKHKHKSSDPTVNVSTSTATSSSVASTVASTLVVAVVIVVA